MTVCPFCEIVAGRAPAEIVDQWPGAISIVPLNPVVRGHVLVLPRRHIVDAVEDPRITGLVMSCAAQIARRPCNLITSAGAEASATIDHYHVHVIPRQAGDGLLLPWSNQSPEVQP